VGGSTIYWKPYSNRKRETAFGQVVLATFGGLHLPQEFTLDRRLLRMPVDARRLEAGLAMDQALPRKRRDLCRQSLATLPDEVIVALDPAQISVDFVVVTEEDYYCWEFHERQHSSLSVDRAKPVYDSSGTEYRVPRFLQRLIRDVWRLQNLPNLTVVWHDWFAANYGRYIPELSAGCVEHHLDGRFSLLALSRK